MLVHDIIALIYYVSVAPIQTAGTGDFVGLHLSGDTTPNTARRSMFSRAVNTLRHSGGKGGNCTRSSSHALYVLAYVPLLHAINTLHSEKKHLYTIATLYVITSRGLNGILLYQKHYFIQSYNSFPFVHRTFFCLYLVGKKSPLIASSLTHLLHENESIRIV